MFKSRAAYSTGFGQRYLYRSTRVIVIRYGLCMADHAFVWVYLILRIRPRPIARFTWITMEIRRHNRTGDGRLITENKLNSVVQNILPLKANCCVVSK